MKSQYILCIDRVMPNGQVQYCWRLYAEPTASELLELIEKEEIKNEYQKGI